MPEGFKKDINQNEVQNKGQSLFAELEEQTKHLTGATKEEQKMRILERKGFVIPQAERMRHYINYVLEIIEKEPEENKITKILNILEKDGIFTKEELEILIMGEKAIGKGGISQQDEKEIENIIKNDSKAIQWIKKILLLGTVLLAPLYNKNKEQVKKENIKNETNIETPVIQTPSSFEKTTTMPTEDTTKIETENETLEKIPAELEKPVEFLKNLDFISGNFLVLDKSNKKSPTLYEITKDGKIISKTTVGIGKQGHETKDGMYMLSKWLKKEDIALYGEKGVLRLLGYSVSGEIVDDMGIHRIYPLEEKERMAKMLNKNAEKNYSLSCINLFYKYFEEHILKDYEKQGGEGKLIIAIMPEKNNFDEKKWKIISQKIREDVRSLEQISNKTTK